MYTIVNIRPFGYNVGNHAIHFVLRHMLYETFGRLVSVIEYPATRKHESTAKAGLTAATVCEINRYADGVIVGGGNLYENNEIDVDQTALRALQPPLMLFSNSRGRIYDRHGVLAERSDVIDDSKLATLLKRADLSLSRDRATHEYLKSLNAHDRMGWCPTINLKRYEDRLPRLPDNEEVGTLISVRTPALMNVPYRFQSSIQSHIELAIDRLRSNGHRRIRILCNDSRDLDFATAFRYTKKVDAVYTNDVYQYLSLLRNARMVISYRLHATLPAISFGVPTVNIAYDERAQCLFDDLGLDKAYLDIVALGDAFPEALVSEIDRGGYMSGDTSHWESITRTQFEGLSRFKEMVDHYLKDGARFNR